MFDKLLRIDFSIVNFDVLTKLSFSTLHYAMCTVTKLFRHCIFYKKLCDFDVQTQHSLDCKLKKMQVHSAKSFLVTSSAQLKFAEQNTFPLNDDNLSLTVTVIAEQ